MPHFNAELVPAMVTPFKRDESVDFEKAERLAVYLAENGCDGILVNAVCPSRIESPLTQDLAIDNEAYLGRSLEQQQSGWGRTVPLGRWGRAEDIADAVAFMASQRASYICGSNIDVDGGHQRMIF